MKKVLVSIRAGLLVRDASGQMSADPRKGLLRVVSDSETMMKFFEWGARDPRTHQLEGEPEVSFIIFPGEGEFRRMAQPGVRAFELVFEDATRPPYFFWAQEPKAEQDAAHAESIQGAINRPLEDEEDWAMEEPVAAPAAPSNNTTAAPSTSAAAPSSGAKPLIDPAFFSKLLAQLQGGGAAAALKGPGLKEVLPSSVLKELFADPAIQERLIPHLPEEHRSASQLMALANSPQFHVQLANLSSALESGDVDPRSFGVEAAGPGVLAFLQALDKGQGESKPGDGK